MLLYYWRYRLLQTNAIEQTKAELTELDNMIKEKENEIVCNKQNCIYTQQHKFTHYTNILLYCYTSISIYTISNHKTFLNIK